MQLSERDVEDDTKGSSRHLEGSIARAETLPETLRREMFALYSRYYGGTSSATFRRDLSKKRYIILLHDEQGTLQGFATIAVAEHEFEGSRVREVFCGDTIVDHRFWGQLALGNTWIHLTGALKGQAPDTPLYWLFLVMGHRTFRFLPTFYHVYFPAHNRPIPAREKRLMDQMASARYPSQYDPRTGIMRFPEAQGFLKAPWHEIPERNRRRPDIKFFIEHNPNYANGDHMAFLCPLTLENQKPLVRRMFLQGMAEPLP